MMNLRILRYCSVAALLLVSGCAGKYTTVRQSEAYDQQRVKRSEITVLPTEAVVNTVDFGGSKERMHDYESHMEDLLSESLVSTLRKNGYKVARLSKKDIHDRGISSQVLSLKQNNDEAVNELYTKYILPQEEAFAITSKVGKPRFDLRNGKVDNIFLLSNYYADVKTSAARAKDILVDALFKTSNASQADVGKVVVTLIDANSGSVLWSNAYIDLKGTFNYAVESLGSSDLEIDRKRADWLASRVLQDLVEEKESQN